MSPQELGSLTPLDPPAPPPIGSLTPLGSGLTPLGGAITQTLGATDTLTPLGGSEGLMPYDPLGKPKTSPQPIKKARKAQNYTLIYILSVVLASVSSIVVTNPGKWSMHFTREANAEKPDTSTTNGSVIEVGVEKGSATSVIVRICSCNKPF